MITNAPNVNRQDYNHVDDQTGLPSAPFLTGGLANVATWVWNTGTLSWAKQTQAAGGGAGGAVTVADGADVAEGATTDVAVVTDVNGTVSGKLRGLVKILASVWDSVNGRLKVDGSAVTQPVSAAALPLPTGAATGANQATGNTSLSSIDGKTPALGQALAAASSPVVLTAIQQAALTPPAAITGFALEAGHLAAIDTSTAKLPAQGQALAAASLPVVLTAAQITTLTPPAAITGFALEAGHLATIDANTPTLGQKTMAGSRPVALASDGLGATQAEAFYTQRRILNTYTAIYRLAARPYALSHVFAAAGRTQFATIHHAATAVKTVKLKRIEVALESSTAAGLIVADLVRITTAPATGNPAITPSPTNTANAAAEATCLCLPTTAATEGALEAMLEWNMGITAAGSVVNPPPGLNWYTLWPQTQGASEAPEDQFPTIRSGVLEGYAVTLDASAALTAKGYVVIEFTEE